MTEMIQQFLTSLWQMLIALLNPLFLIPILAVLIIYIIENRKYKSSIYYQITKVPLLLLRSDLGKYGEYLTYKQLKHFEKDGAKFLFNVYIPKDNGETTEIDVLMLTRKGIFVFESKNYSGWIFGSENQKNWYQTLPSGRGRSHKENFYNPIMQNRSHIKHLKALIGEQLPMHSVIVFSERCTLKNVTIKSNEINVINRNQVSVVVSDICKAISENIATDEDVANLYNKLYAYTQVSEAEKTQHIVNVRNNSTKKTNPISSEETVEIDEGTNKANLTEAVLPTSISADDIADTEAVANEPLNEQLDNTDDIDLTDNVETCDICPKCGGKLVLRTAAKGTNTGKQFFGCTNFPKCRYIKSVE